MDSLAPHPEALSRPSQPYRERLLAVMAETCAGSAKARDPAVGERLAAGFLSVLAGAEEDARARFAAKLAPADWPPRALVAHLALDALPVAQPVIAHSPRLSDDDLERVLAEGSPEHRAAVARRARPSPRLAEAVVDTGEPLALAALAGNLEADLPLPALRRLVESARRQVAVRAPLARRGDLGRDLAGRLSESVGDDLRAELTERYDLQPTPIRALADDAEAEARLVSKLEAADQLKPGVLLRTLREGKGSLFEAALASLGGFDRAQVSRAIRSERPELLAFACTAVGIDRSVFPTVLELVRGLNAGAPASLDPSAGGFEGALAVTDARAAAQAFRDGVEAL